MPTRVMPTFAIPAIVEIYLANFKTSLAVQFQYRVAMLIWMLGRVVQPLILMTVWTTVAQARGGEVAGYDAGGFAAYFIMQMIVSQATFSWIMWEYDYVIRSGQFNFRLLRPVHPIHSDVADNLAYKALTLVILIPAAFVLAWLFPPTFNAQAWSIAAGLLSVVVGFVMRFTLEWTIAMSALWMSRINAINQSYDVMLIFLSGFFAPLAVMPQWLQTLANITPFQWWLSFPIELFLGRLTPQQALQGFAMQLLWLTLALALLSYVWRVGIKQYSAVGS